MDMMKRFVISGIKETKIIDTPIPKPKEDWVLVKVHAIPLCTEYKGWLSGRGYDGHEAAGEVMAVVQPGKVKAGDRVVVMPIWPCGKCDLCISGEYIHCHHLYDYQSFTGLDYNGDTHVQYLIKQDWLLAPIPDGVSYIKASLACCGLGPTFGAMENAQTDAFSTILITGAGPVGLGGVVNAKYRGARVIAVESIPYRQQKAKELGADLVLDPKDPEIRNKIMAYSASKGVDSCFETSGTVEAQRLCIDVVRRKGRVALIGECDDNLEIKASPDFIRKGINLSGQWHYNLNGIPKIMEIIKNSSMLDKFITHVFPMSSIQEALEVCASQYCGKVVIKPWEE